MAASDYVLIFFKNCLHLVGRPQMSTRPSHCLDRLAPMVKRPSDISLALIDRGAIWHEFDSAPVALFCREKLKSSRR